jgi:mannose-1-phosphate guanylyltransferase
VLWTGENTQGRNSIDETLCFLQQSLERAEQMIPPEQLFLVVGKQSLDCDDVRRQLASRPAGSVIVQPQNKDTSPDILHSLMRVAKRDPTAAVAIFPIDQFTAPDPHLGQQVERAFGVVEADGSHIIFLGATPTPQDAGRMYIVPNGRNIRPDWDGVRTVEMFVDTPSADAAAMLMRRGALSNTLILVVTCRTLLEAITSAAPALYRSFEPLKAGLGTADEPEAVKKAYQESPALNLYDGVLKRLPNEKRQKLCVMSVQAVTVAKTQRSSAARAVAASL